MLGLLVHISYVLAVLLWGILRCALPWISVAHLGKSLLRDIRWADGLANIDKHSYFRPRAMGHADMEGHEFYDLYKIALCIVIGFFG